MLDFRHRIDEDLALLPPLPRYAAGLFKALETSREHVGSFLSWVEKTKTEQDVRDRIASRCKAFGRNKGADYTITYRGEAAGVVGLNNIDTRHRLGAIGYWLADAYSGRGLMTRSAEAVVKQAHAGPGLERVEIRCSVENKRSRAVIERLGLPLQATARDGDPLPDGRITDQLIFASVRDRSTSLAERIEFAIPTEREDVRVCLQQPHDVRELFKLIERERDGLAPWNPFASQVRRPRDYRKKMRQSWDAMSNGGPGVQCVIQLDGDIVGGIGVHGFSEVTRHAEFGYWLGERARGHGIMSAALRALERYAWNIDQTLVRLQLRVAKDNAKSVALAERLGYRREGELPREYRTLGVSRDVILFGKTREDRDE